jgi:hypothetical protein
MLSCRLPLPKDVPMTFRVLPEFIIEDVVEFFLFVVRYGFVAFVECTWELMGWKALARES